MATYGLTVDGFVPKPLTVIREELNEALRSAFGNSIDLGDRSIFGQIVGILAERYALLWELAEAVNSSQDPDKATGDALEAICTITGTFRPQAEFSVVTLTLTGTPTTVVPADSGVSTTSTGKIFKTREQKTIAALSAWTGTTAYLVGARVTNASRCYECIQAGTSAGSGGPTTTASEITDGGAKWTYLGEGTGAVDVGADSEDTGAITAAARDITTIENDVFGWDSVINLEDADPGRDEAKDEELRLLREEELAKAGSTTVDAIHAALVALDDVVSVHVFVNNSDSTVDGMPPHSVEALVRGPDPLPADFDQNMFDALLANVAAGIQTHGNTPGTAVDSQGTSHTMKYSQPTEVEVWAILTIKYEDGIYPADGDAQIKQAIVDFGDAQKTGKDVTSSSLIAQAHKISGVLEVTSCLIGTANPPVSSATIPIALRELATFDTSRITINSSAATP